MDPATIVGMDQHIAISLHDQRVAPVFDVSRQFLILSDGGTTGTTGSVITVSEGDPCRKALLLEKLQVKTIICGGISETAAMFIRGRGMALHAFIRGTVTEVLEAFRAHTLDEARFVMPGVLARKNGTGPAGSRLSHG